MRAHGRSRRYSVAVLLITPSLEGEDAHSVTTIKSQKKTNFRFFSATFTLSLQVLLTMCRSLLIAKAVRAELQRCLGKAPIACSLSPLPASLPPWPPGHAGSLAPRPFDMPLAALQRDSFSSRRTVEGLHGVRAAARCYEQVSFEH